METQNEIASTITILIFLGTLVAMLGLYIWSLRWLYEDAQKRGNIGCLMVILVAIFAWPLGLLVWLFARPPIKNQL